jgi:hypothetical protein
MQRRIDQHNASDLADVDLTELMGAMASQPPEQHSAKPTGGITATHLIAPMPASISPRVG